MALSPYSLSSYTIDVADYYLEKFTFVLVIK